MAFDYMHPPEDFEYLGEWCKAWRDPATGDWTISQLLDGLDTEQIILSGEEVFCFNVCSTGSAVFFRSVG